MDSTNRIRFPFYFFFLSKSVNFKRSDFRVTHCGYRSKLNQFSTHNEKKSKIFKSSAIYSATTKLTVFSLIRCYCSPPIINRSECSFFRYSKCKGEKHGNGEAIKRDYKSNYWSSNEKKREWKWKREKRYFETRVNNMGFQ